MTTILGDIQNSIDSVSKQLDIGGYSLNKRIGFFLWIAFPPQLFCGSVLLVPEKKPAERAAKECLCQKSEFFLVAINVVKWGATHKFLDLFSHMSNIQEHMYPGHRCV